MLTALFFPLWIKHEDGNFQWLQVCIDIIPSMLGFSMGGMAIMLAFSGMSSFPIITQGGINNSTFLKVVANFFHFIIVQSICLIITISIKAYPYKILSFIGFVLFIYAIMVGVATAGQIFNIARVYNKASGIKEKSQNENKI